MGRKILTINDYLEPIEVPSKLLSGRDIIDAPMYSPLVREWYEEQIDYVLNGITINGKFWNPLIYHFLNFYYFPVQYIDRKTGEVQSYDEPGMPLFSRIDEYIFDKMWEAMNSSQHIALLGSRGLGKSYIATSIMNRRYNFFPKSDIIVSASMKTHVDTAWDKVIETLGAFEKKHPALKQKRITNSNTKLKSGEEVDTDYGKEERGYLCTYEKILYGKSPGKTRSRRPNIQLVEEFGAFPSTGLGNLKDVLAQSRGSNLIGGTIMKNFMMLMGTGGSISNDHAKEIFHKPDAYNFLAINEWDGMKTALFIPVQYKLAGTWEKNGVPDIEKALKINNKERQKLKDAGEFVSLQNYCQEYPQNTREVFLKKGTNRFNQDKIAQQISIVDTVEVSMKVKKGYFQYTKTDDNVITGVEFINNGIGPIFMIEEVQKSPEGKYYEDLYVMGLDSIDMGGNDSTTDEGSKLAALVKKRIITGDNKSTRSIYVCWYNERHPEVRDDYENVLMMTLYYRCKINLEYTKFNILSYFREKHMSRYFMKRPTIALGNIDGDKKSTLIGTPATADMIDHQDAKIIDYVNDYSQQIFILPLLEQLRDYHREDRTPYDLVIAMGLCELADEDYIGIGAKVEREYASTGMTKDAFSFSRNTDGEKKFGEKQDNKTTVQKYTYMSDITWIDETGKPRFDDELLDVMKDELF